VFFVQSGAWFGPYRRCAASPQRIKAQQHSRTAGLRPWTSLDAFGAAFRRGAAAEREEAPKP